MSIAYYHRPCGNLLLFWRGDTPPVKGQIMEPTDWQLPNGNLLDSSAEVRRICPHCKQQWDFTSQSLTPDLPKTT